MRLFRIIFLMTACLIPLGTNASVRIKDIVHFQGVRNNQLIGYGLVVGLSGSGDSMGGSPYTQESLITLLERLGVNSRGMSVAPKNVAAVMVTAHLPPFAKKGSEIDVSVSTLGDAASLLGGTLLITPLLGADGEVYAVGQGPIAVHGYTAKGASGSSVIKGVPTSGRIAGGAIVEKEIAFDMSSMKTMDLALRNPDFTTAQRISESINKHFHTHDLAVATDPSTVTVSMPVGSDRILPFMTELEQLRVTTDNVAKVVIDETTGVIVIGADVHIDTVAIAQGNLTIRIDETPQVSQPGALSQGTTKVVPRSKIKAEEVGKKFSVLKQSISLQELVDGLNSLGVGPRDIISILMAIKAAGALQSDIEVI